MGGVWGDNSPYDNAGMPFAADTVDYDNKAELALKMVKDKEPEDYGADTPELTVNPTPQHDFQTDQVEVPPVYDVTSNNGALEELSHPADLMEALASVDKPISAEPVPVATEEQPVSDTPLFDETASQDGQA